VGCYYGFEKRANEVATHGINRFAYANRTPPRWAQKQRKPLRTKMFAYANAAFAYANPRRGDVSPLCRRAVPFPGFFSGDLVESWWQLNAITTVEEPS